MLTEDGSRVICAERLCPCDPADPELCEVGYQDISGPGPIKSPGGGGRQPLRSKVGPVQGGNCCCPRGHLPAWGTTSGDSSHFCLNIFHWIDFAVKHLKGRFKTDSLSNSVTRFHAKAFKPAYIQKAPCALGPYFLKTLDIW